MRYCVRLSLVAFFVLSCEGVKESQPVSGAVPEDASWESQEEDAIESEEPEVVACSELGEQETNIQKNVKGKGRGQTKKMELLSHENYQKTKAHWSGADDCIAVIIEDNEDIVSEITASNI